MRIDFSRSISSSQQEFDPPAPKPGEIWELSRAVKSPLEFSSEEQQNLYSDVAKRFLEGNAPPRYVMIVTPEPLIGPESEWQMVSVMLLSGETRFLSDVNLLIPSSVSGLGQDLLAQTWHVLLMLTCNLLQPVGQRLSREIYDLLLTVGDYYHGLVDQAPLIQEIQSVGLRVGAVWAKQQPEIQVFHQQEVAWADVLTVPVAAYRTYLKTLKLTEAILDSALQLEQEFSFVAVEALDQSQTEANDTAVTTVASFAASKTRVSLNQWFQNVWETGWQTVEEILNTLGTPEANLAYGSRSAALSRESSPAIEALIELLHTNRDKSTLLGAVDLLGHIAPGNSDAIIALTDLLSTTRDDDTRRQAAVSLGKIDPGNWAAGVRRAKVIDLGLLLDAHRVALVVTLMPEADHRTNINFRVYPTGGQTYLPPNLQLIVLDESGEAIMSAQSRSADNSIQLGFRGDRGDCFSVKVALGDASVTEDFVI